MRILVIGGIAAAALLADHDYDVDLVEVITTEIAVVGEYHSFLVAPTPVTIKPSLLAFQCGPAPDREILSYAWPNDPPRGRLLSPASEYG